MDQSTAALALWQLSDDELTARFCWRARHDWAGTTAGAQLGWSYSFVAALEPGRASRTAILDARRPGPDDEDIGSAAVQLRTVVEGRRPRDLDHRGNRMRLPRRRNNKQRKTQAETYSLGELMQNDETAVRGLVEPLVVGSDVLIDKFEDSAIQLGRVFG